MTGLIVFDLFCSEEINTGIGCLQGFMKELRLFEILLTLKGHCVNTRFWRN